jgi:hypothetical protein
MRAMESSGAMRYPAYAPPRSENGTEIAMASSPVFQALALPTSSITPSMPGIYGVLRRWCRSRRIGALGLSG